MATGNFTKGDVFVANDDNTITRIAAGAAGKSLVSNGAGQLPTYQTAGAKNVLIQTTAVANAGAGPDTLISEYLPTGILAATHDRLVIHAFGITSPGNANNKTINFRISDGSSALLYTTGSKAFLGMDWSIRAEIIRTGASTQLAVVVFTCNGNIVDQWVKTPSLTLNDANQWWVYCTSESGAVAAAADVTQKGLIVDYIPAAA